MEGPQADEKGPHYIKKEKKTGETSVEDEKRSCKGFKIDAVDAWWLL